MMQTLQECIFCFACFAVMYMSALESFPYVISNSILAVGKSTITLLYQRVVPGIQVPGGMGTMGPILQH